MEQCPFMRSGQTSVGSSAFKFAHLEGSPHHHSAKISVTAVMAIGKRTPKSS